MSYPHTVGKDLEDAFHGEQTRESPVEVLKRIGEAIILLVMLLTYKVAILPQLVFVLQHLHF